MTDDADGNAMNPREAKRMAQGLAVAISLAFGVSVAVAVAGTSPAAASDLASAPVMVRVAAVNSPELTRFIVG